jgi:DNA-directed RNA polymerase specialized sigma24 family protein
MNNDIRYTPSQALHTQQWLELYTWLLPLAKRWVWNANVPLWQGQQQDIAEDIVQEAVARTFTYHQLGRTGKVPSITMLKPFSRKVAHNYFYDRRRKDSRVVRLSDLQPTSGDVLYDPGHIAIEHLVLRSTIHMVVRLIVTLPPRQKEVVLKDLASAASPEGNAGMLEQALAEHDIQLFYYRGQLSSDLAERKRDAALRYVAYKRLKKALGD